LPDDRQEFELPDAVHEQIFFQEDGGVAKGGARFTLGFFQRGI